MWSGKPLTLNRNRKKAGMYATRTRVHGAKDYAEINNYEQFPFQEITEHGFHDGHQINLDAYLAKKKKKRFNRY